MKFDNILRLNFSDGDYYCPMPIEKLQNDTQTMIPFGENNTFPQDVLFLSEKTSLVSTIIDKITKYVFGEGIETDLATKIVDDNGTTFNELVYGVINDYITFGSFAIQVRRNSLGDIKKLDRLHVERLRTNEDNDKFWYSKKWSKFARPNLVYDAYKGLGAKSQSDSIFYFKNPSGRHIYGYAPWWCAINDVVTCLALGEYGVNTVNNCFTPSAIITLCEGKPTKEEAKSVERELNEKFAGTRNNAKLLVAFADGPESAPQITPFQSADLNAHFLSLKDMVRENILAAFCLDGVLIGLHTNDGVFSQGAFMESYDLFQKTEILPIQQNIVKAFKKLGYTISFKPFVINWSRNNETSDDTIIK